MPEPVRRPLSTEDLPWLKAYVEAEVAVQVGKHTHETLGGFDYEPDKRARDEAWARLKGRRAGDG